MAKDVTPITRCRVCGDERIIPFFDLGRQPLANTLPKSPGERERTYPLSLSRCARCSVVQLNHTVRPEILFRDYVWVTATSETARTFAETFCRELIRRASSRKGDVVVELASNDGTFLLPFMRKGYRVLGVDPAKNIAAVARQNGIPTRDIFFGASAARALLRETGPAKMIVARNVLPHVANTVDFVEGIAHYLDRTGVAAIEVHDASHIHKGLQYDSIYHEHLIWFTLRTLEQLLGMHGLTAFDVGESPINAGALIIYAAKFPREEKAVVSRIRRNEAREGINTLAAWRNFAKRAYGHRETLRNALEGARARGEAVVGYGASARSSTLLNFCGITPQLLPVIADMNPLKQGRYTAGTRIPIKNPEMVFRKHPDCVVVLAWNFEEEIRKFLREKFGYRGRFLVPFPSKVRDVR